MIRQVLPSAEIHWVVDAKLAELPQNMPFIDQVHCLKRLSEARGLRSFDFDYVIDLQGLLKSAWVAWLIRGKQRWGFSWSAARENAASLFYSHKVFIDYQTNIFERNLRLVLAVLKQPQSSFESYLNWSWPLFESHATLPEVLPNVANFILIVPGASDALKVPSVSVYQKIIMQLNEPVFLTWGNDSEYQRAKAIAHEVSHIHVLPELNLSELMCLMKKSTAVLGPDTGIVHLGQALCRPSVTLFSEKAKSPAIRNAFSTLMHRPLSFADLQQLSEDAIEHIVDTLKVCIKHDQKNKL